MLMFAMRYLSYTTLATASLVVLLLFYATPSRSEQYSWIALSVLLLADAVIILSVPRVRSEEGWVGIASVILATIITAWAVCFRIPYSLWGIVLGYLR